MSIVGLLCLLFALIAALVLVLYALQRRDLRSSRGTVAAVTAHRHRRPAPGPGGGRERQARSGRPGHRGQPPADSGGAGRRARGGASAETLRRARRSHSRGRTGAPRGDPVRQPAVCQFRRRRSHRAHRAAPRGPRAAGILRAGQREHPPPAGGRDGGRALRDRHGRPAGAGEPPRDHLDAGRLRQGQRAADHRRGDHSHADAAGAARRPSTTAPSRSCWLSTRSPRRSSPPTRTAASPS